MEPVVAKLVTFEGSVQGVGFRYTANSLAWRFNVTGYVMNMPNGSVEIHAEGPVDEVDCFIDAVKTEMAEYIQEVKTQPVPAAAQYRRFSVRF